MNPPPMVLCVWEDATVLDDGPWTDNAVSTEYAPRLISQVGFLVADLPQGIQLSEAVGEGLMAPRTQVPRAMVRSITLLKPSKARK